MRLSALSWPIAAFGGRSSARATNGTCQIRASRRALAKSKAYLAKRPPALRFGAHPRGLAREYSAAPRSPNRRKTVLERLGPKLRASTETGDERSRFHSVRE